jgi:hypothetical protein
VTDPLRASDADREATAARLRGGMEEGRISVDELEERVGTAYRARTRAELDLLVADLPAGPPAPAAAGRVSVRPGPGGSRWIVSVMGANDRTGRWRLAPRCRVIDVMGRSDIDLTEVELAADRVELTVFSLMGGADLRLPASLNVEISKLVLMGGHDVDLGTPPADPGGPVLHIRLVSIMGGARVRRSSGPERLGRARRPNLEAPPVSGRDSRP